MNKILVVRFSSIGDIILTSPVVRCLKEQVPGAEVHYIVKKQFAGIVASIGGVDRIWSYDGRFSELIPQLKAENFDFIVDLHKNLRSFTVRTRLGVRSASFTKLNLRKWLTVRFKMNVLPGIHIVDRYFEAVQPLGVKNDGEGLNYFITPADEVAAGTLPDTHRGKFVAVVIGGKHHTKIFPPEKVAAVCSKLSLPVVLLGGQEDRARGEKIVQAVGGKAFNACGLFSFNQSASLLRQSVAVLTNDTGLMHVAAAFRKPVASVWGNTIPEFGMYPYLPGEPSTPSYISEVKGLSCRPCSKIGYDACPRGHFRCMEEIDVQRVAGFLNGDA